MEIEYMELALKEARKAAARDEVPVGCIIVDPAEGKIVSRAGNAGEKRHCLCHAELVAIEKALKKRGAARLWGLDMYVTLEPCAMCALSPYLSPALRAFISARMMKRAGRWRTA